MRAQVELPTMGIAFVLLTAALVLGISVANDALTTAERPALEREAAVSLSDQLVSESAPLTARANVVQEPAIAGLNASVLSSRYGLANDSSATVQLDGETIATAGDPATGTTVERLVLVENTTTERVTPTFADSLSTTLPRRATNVTIMLDPPEPIAVQSVTGNGEILLTNESGLEGRFSIPVSQLETTELRFEATGRLSEGDVTLSYETGETRKATLAVTVDA